MTARTRGPRIGLLVLHGMGSQEPGYSLPLQTALRALLGAQAGRFVFREVYWARALEDPEKRLWILMNSARDPDGTPIALRWRAMRDFIVHSFADALGYDRRGEGSRYEAVHGIVDAGVRDLYDEVGAEAPVVVLAHSLGAHIVSNYVWDTEPRPTHLPDCDGSDGGPSGSPRHSPWRPIDTLAGMVTFGANIPLFSLSFDRAEPIVLPGAGLTHAAARAHAAWLNFLDADDVLGWPLRTLYAPEAQAAARAAARAAAGVSRAETSELGHSLELPETTIAPEDAPAGRTMHCRRRETVSRIRDLPIAAGPFLRGLTPLSHAEYWTDPDLLRPTAAWLRALAAVLDG